MLAIRVKHALELICGRLKCVEQCIDFRAPGKIGKNYAEMTPYVTVRCKVGRGERAGPRVLARRAQHAFLSRYERLNFDLQRVDFWAPDKIGGNESETTPYCVAHCRAGRGERGYRCV